MKTTYEIVTTDGDSFNVYSTENLVSKYEEAKAQGEEFLTWENGIFELVHMQGIMPVKEEK